MEPHAGEGRRVAVWGHAAGTEGSEPAPAAAQPWPARALGRLTVEQRDALAGRLRLARSQEMAPRRLLDALYPPRPAADVADSTLLCRCEEVSAGQVRAAVALGCLGANQLKSFTRAGMGPCQGRVCGPAVHATIAAARGVAPDAVEPYRTRFPTKPLTLGELAAMWEAT